MKDAQVLTLDELKKENEAEEKKLTENKEVIETEVEEEIKDDDKKEEKEVIDENKAWLETEEKEVKEVFDASDVAAVRRKWKGKVQEKNAEIDELKTKIHELENKQIKPSEHLKDRPKREDFEDDEKYFDALTDYKIKISREQDDSKSIVEQKKRAQQEKLQKVSQEVDKHYLRAAKLAEKSGITPEAYQAADLNVRKAVDSVFPEGGDSITDALISNLGEGSEKVLYNLGVNSTRRAKFTSLLTDDPSGLKAATYLGELKAQLSVPVKRTSAAPEPMDEIQGDKSGSASSRQLKEEYEKAHKAGNIQKAFDIKHKAKGMKIDTRDW